MSEKLEISTDKNKLQLEVIHGVLSQSYWADWRSLAQIKLSIAQTDCFGAYIDGVQVGFMRVLTDRIAFAYLMDVFVIPEMQGRGYAQMLLQAVFDDERYQQVNKWLLITRDAHTLYEKKGFKPLAAPEQFMERGRFG